MVARKRQIVRTFDLRGKASSAAPAIKAAPVVKAKEPSPSPKEGEAARQAQLAIDKERAARERRKQLRRDRKAAEEAARQFLAETWPALFADPVPLPIGMAQIVHAAGKAAGCTGGRRERHKVALSWWCGSPAYLAALAEDGAMRRDVDGAPVEPVSEEHRQYAIQRLALVSRA